MERIKLLIFDFDNCIADILSVAEKVYNELAPIYFHKDIDIRRIIKHEGIKSAIRKSGIRLWRIPFIVRNFRRGMTQHFHEAKPHKGMLQVIKKLKKQYKIAILTSNSRENVEQFFIQYDMTDDFDHIKANAGLFTKAWHIKRIMKKFKVKNSETIMIGDETRDVMAARQANIKSIAVTWGINSEELLRKRKPTFVLKTPEEITALLSLEV